MAFLTLQTRYGYWYFVDGVLLPLDVVGDLLIPTDHTATPDNTPPQQWQQIVDSVRDYVDADPTEIQCLRGYGSRYSASGYLDCTGWVFGETASEAETAAEDSYGDLEIPG